MSSVSLYEHVLELCAGLVVSLLEENELKPELPQFHDFLTSTRVTCQTNPTVTQVTNRESLSYLQFIDAWFAATSPSRGDVGETDIDYRSHMLKTPNWERLCHRIGRKSFEALLASLKSVQLAGGASIEFGPTKVYRKYGQRSIITKSSMYYRLGPPRGRVWLLEELALELTCMIVGMTDKPRNLPKKYRGLLRIISSAKNNENKVSYRGMVKQLIPARDTCEPVFDNCSPLAHVTRLVLTIIHKLFPNETFGCSSNNIVVNNIVSYMLSSNRRVVIDTQAIMLRIKLSSIPWLGKTTHMTSLQDTRMRERLLAGFLRWFFSYFVTRLVRSFWYVSDVPRQVGNRLEVNNYFLHLTWGRLTSVWIAEYVKQYLHPVADASALQPRLQGFNYGFLRVVPKLMDFRPLSIPIKTTATLFDEHKNRRAQKRAHQLFDTNFVRPIRDILRYKQAQQMHRDPSIAPPCHSVAEVGRHILEFKRLLLAAHQGKIPSLHAIQFDMKHCYDNLNQSKILSCVHDLFANDSPSDSYTIRRLRISSRTGRLRSLVKSRSNIAELDVTKYKPNFVKNCEVVSNHARLQKFNKNDIIDLVRHQVIDPLIKISGTQGGLYRRIQGVYQGFPLLATLCEVVYNAFIREVLLVDGPPENSCLLLRLADDFLFLSTSEAACEEVLSRAMSAAANEYGAFVNQDKICRMYGKENMPRVAQFLGVQIDLHSLAVQKDNFQPINVPATSKRSLKLSLSFLERLLRSKMSGYLLNLSLADERVISKNIASILERILQSALRQYTEFRKDLDAEATLEYFVAQVILAILECLAFVNGSRPESNEVLHEALRVMQKQLASELRILQRVFYFLNV